MLLVNVSRSFRNAIVLREQQITECALIVSACWPHCHHCRGHGLIRIHHHSFFSLPQSKYDQMGERSQLLISYRKVLFSIDSNCLINFHWKQAFAEPLQLLFWYLRYRIAAWGARWGLWKTEPCATSTKQALWQNQRHKGVHFRARRAGRYRRRYLVETLDRKMRCKALQDRCIW